MVVGAYLGTHGFVGAPAAPGAAAELSSGASGPVSAGRLDPEEVYIREVAEGSPALGPGAFSRVQGGESRSGRTGPYPPRSGCERAG